MAGRPRSQSCTTRESARRVRGRRTGRARTPHPCGSLNRQATQGRAQRAADVLSSHELTERRAGRPCGANIGRAVDLAHEAAAGGARFVGLPEYLHYRGGDNGFRASARPIPGPLTDPFAEVARKNGAWILVGSVAETSGDADRPHNTSVLIAPDGSIAATYRKVHLFDVAVESGPSDVESARVTAGEHQVCADVDGVRVGLSVCYDLRFPELYRSLALAGAEVLTVPANFTERTGRDHWEVLLRARAIENGAWVLAPSQIGGPPGQPAYGRSMVIDPWGTVVAQAPDRVGIIRTEIDTDRVASVRRQIPSLANRRPGAYRL